MCWCMAAGLRWFRGSGANQKNSTDHSSYQSLLSSVYANVSTAKMMYYHNKINNCSDSCTLFKTFSSLLCPSHPSLLLHQLLRSLHTPSPKYLYTLKKVIFIILSYYNACYACKNSENQTWSYFFYDGRKFWRQCVNVIDTMWDRIFFLLA